MSETFVYVLVALVFLAAGGGAGFWFGQKRGREDAAKSTDVRQEFDAYREQVSEHFSATADHFQALGRQVRQLYDHMSDGADRLCNKESAGESIEFSAAGALAAMADESSEVRETPAADEAEEQATGDVAADTDQPDGSAAAAGRGEDTDDTVGQARAEEPNASFAVATAEDEEPEKRSYH